MFKKLFLVILLSPVMMARAEETARYGFSANPMARPATAARAPTLPGLNVIVGGTISAGTAASSVSASDSRCSATLPDQITLTRCVQKYMSCLKQDSVCGDHFESCDSKQRFNQKKIFCQEKLMECPDEGIGALYGKTVKSATTTATCSGEQKVVARTFTSPAGGLANLDFDYSATSALQTSQIAQAIYDGGGWVAANSFSACNNTADGCIKRACQNQAFKCTLSNGALDYVSIAAGASGANSTQFRVPESMVKQYVDNMVWDSDRVKKYIKETCQAEVGTSRACFIVANGDLPKNDAWTADSFETSTVYDDVMTGSLNRIGANQPKILEWLAQGIGTAINTCKTTARTCVTNICGSGSIAACYGLAQNTANKTIGEIPGIGNKCESIINNDQNCRDLLTDSGDTGSLWSKIWSTTTGGVPTDNFGLVAELDKELFNMFSEAAVRNMFTQCRSEAESCIRRECGTGFKSCYINDKWLSSNSALAGNADYGTTVLDGQGSASATSNAAGGFDTIMAKSLCLIPVKKSETCQNYFDIQYAKSNSSSGYTFGGSWNSMSNAWSAAGSGYSTATTNSFGSTQTETCSALKNYHQMSQTCDPSDPSCTESSTISTGSAAAAKCATYEAGIFGELIADVAMSARAQLTKEQNAVKNTCESHRGQNSMGDTYMWASKLTDGGIDSNIEDGKYETMGLSSKHDATADLWGAFCQVKVSLQSTDDRLRKLFQDGKINYEEVVEAQEAEAFFQMFTGDKTSTESRSVTFKSKTSAYFSLGDVVTCGSWLLQTDLDGIEMVIRGDAAVKKFKEQGWFNKHGAQIAGLVGAAGGGIGGYFAGDAIQGMLTKGTVTLEDKHNAMTALVGKIEEVDINNTKNVKEKQKNNPNYLNANYLEKCNESAVGGLLQKAFGVKASVDTQIKGLGENNQEKYKCTKENAIASWDGLKDVSDTIKIFDYRCGASEGSVLATGDSKANRQEASDQYDRAVAACQKVANAKTAKGEVGIGKTANLIGAGVGALGGGLLTGGIAQSAINSANRMAEAKAGDAAVNEWFGEVGSKIQCVIGGKVVGTYGDTIELK